MHGGCDETMKGDAAWIPEPVDHAYIEQIAEPVHPVLEAIERAAHPERIPILDRAEGRVLSVLSAGRRRVLEVGTAYGYSTLWIALGQPSDGTIVTLDPDRERTAIAREFWREADIPDERIAVVNRPALEAFADPTESSLAGPFDLAFIDALKPEYQAYLDAIAPRLETGGIVVADNVLWSGRASGGRPDSQGRADATSAIRAFNASLLRDQRFISTILPVGDGLLIAALRAGGR